MLHNSETQPHSRRSRHAELPIGVRLMLSRVSAMFARSHERQHELERELRHRGTPR